MKEELTKLIQQAIDGDLAAFEQVMQQKAKQIVYVSVKLMKNQEDGEDAAQEAMLKMYQHLKELKDPEAFQSWMYQIITRTCIDIRRKQLVHEDHDYLETRSEVREMRREFLPQDYIEDVDKRDFLMKQINNLPENYRICLLLFYYEDMSYQQISQVMGIPEKSVDNILQRGKRSIKKQLERRYGEKMKLLSLQGAALPVMTQLFQWDAALHTSPEMLSRMLSDVGTAVTATAVGTAGGAAAVAASGAGASTAGAVSAEALASGAATATGGSAAATAGVLGISTKAVAGIAVALAVTGGAAVVLYPGSGAEPFPADDPPGSEELAILTLEDMIGQEKADSLRSFAAGDQEPSLWEELLEDLAAANISGAVLGEARYTLYHLEKQDKQLLILEKIDMDGLEVAYRFTDSHEEAPKRDELFSSLEGWKQ